MASRMVEHIEIHLASCGLQSTWAVEAAHRAVGLTRQMREGRARTCQGGSDGTFMWQRLLSVRRRPR